LNLDLVGKIDLAEFTLLYQDHFSDLMLNTPPSSSSSSPPSTTPPSSTTGIEPIQEEEKETNPRQRVVNPSQRDTNSRPKPSNASKSVKKKKKESVSAVEQAKEMRLFLEESTQALALSP